MLLLGLHDQRLPFILNRYHSTGYGLVSSPDVQPLAVRVFMTFWPNEHHLPCETWLFIPLNAFLIPV